jgi:hypothetical protein
MSVLTISTISVITERSYTDILRTPCLADTTEIIITDAAKKLIFIHNVSITNAPVLTIETVADAYKRTVDPTAINPVTVPIGKFYSLGPYSSALYGLGADKVDIHIGVTGSDLTNLFVSVIDLTVIPY